VDQFVILAPSGQVYNSDQIEASEPGQYGIWVIGSNGCITRDTVDIDAFLEKPETQLQVEGPITCAHPNVWIQASFPGENINYFWHGPAQFFSSDTAIWVSEPGTYTLELVNMHGCSNAYSIQVEAMADKPILQLTGNDIDCRVPTSRLSFSSQDSIIWIRWSDGHGTVISNKYEILVNEGGWYFLEAINPYGCRETDSIFIASNTEEPEIRVLSDNPLLVETFTEPRAQLHVDVESGSAFDIFWIPSEGLSCSDCLSPIILGNQIEQYLVRVTNAYGCVAEETLEIRYKNKTIIEIPNVFTPDNQDGLNDYFSLFSNENVLLVNDLMIYDRWGNLVAHQTNFPPNAPEYGWDGRFRGQFAVKGVYVYYFKVTTTNGEILYFSGDVTIL
jgi:gliding motility-associated-like protein